MFENTDIDKHAFECIPLDRDCFLMSEIYMKEFDEALDRMLRGEECNPYEVGYVSPVAVRRVNGASLELSWYPNTYTRFHEVSISLPNEMIKICVDCWKYDIKPYIFVDHRWLERLYLREYSVFALVDAIGVKHLIIKNAISKEQLIRLRDRIDRLAEDQTDLSFISFADSLIIKSNWDVGYFESGVECTYSPEKMLHVIKELERIYREILGLEIYAVLTQGSNEYYGEPLLHISSAMNHVCLNSLGIPFAELMAIESSAKLAIKLGVHPPMQVYLDEQFYHSLKFKFDFEKNEKPKSPYSPIMKSKTPNYFYSSCDVLIANLDTRPDKI